MSCAGRRGRERRAVDEVEAAGELGRQLSSPQAAVGDVAERRKRLLCVAEHPLRDVEGVEPGDAWSDVRRNAASTHPDLRHARLRCQVREDVLVEHSLEVGRRSPLVAEHPDLRADVLLPRLAAGVDLQRDDIGSPLPAVRAPEHPVDERAVAVARLQDHLRERAHDSAEDESRVEAHPRHDRAQVCRFTSPPAPPGAGASAGGRARDRALRVRCRQRGSRAGGRAGRSGARAGRAWRARRGAAASRRTGARGPRCFEIGPEEHEVVAGGTPSREPPVDHPDAVVAEEEMAAVEVAVARGGRQRRAPDEPPRTGEVCER